MKIIESSKLAITAALACLLVGCGDKKSDQAKNAPVPQPAPSTGAKVLNLYTWEEYFDTETIEAFEEQTGVKVIYKTFESTDEMEAKLLSEPGAYDVVVVDGQILEGMRERNLIRDLDHSKLPNLANIGDDFRDMPFDPGNKITTPYVWGSTLVAYRTDIISDPEKSWSLLWDERVKGKVMLYDERYEVIRIQGFSLGHLFNTADPKHIAEAADHLVDGIRRSGARLGSDADVREGLTDGSLHAAMCYSGDAAMVAEENENIGWFIPKEGAPLWVDCFAITQSSTNPDLAHAFVNHMLDAEMGAKNVNTVCFATPNEASKPFVEAELIEDESIYPPASVMKRCEWYRKADPNLEDAFNEGWLRVLRTVREQSATASLEAGEPE